MDESNKASSSDEEHHRDKNHNTGKHSPRMSSKSPKISPKFMKSRKPWFPKLKSSELLFHLNLDKLGYWGLKNKILTEWENILKEKKMELEKMKKTSYKEEVQRQLENQKAA
jgi:hypothetical protein